MARPLQSDALDAARLAIARFRAEGEEGPLRAVRHATRTSARALQCERVGVWFFVGESEGAIAAPLVFELSRGAWNEDPTVLDERDCPAYFTAIREKRVVAVDDALDDPRTRELVDAYLIPRRVGALLDVPIYRAGEVIGVLCHEHVGGRRSWTGDECAFATSVADMLAVVLESARLLDCERTLRALDRERGERRHDESVARIAGALGHDVNNLLTVILAAASQLQHADSAAAAFAIREAAARGAALTKELLLLARGDEGPARAPAHVPLTLESMRPLIEQLVAPCGLDWLVDADDAHVPADSAELERIVLNLVRNAREAIDGEGRIGVRALAQGSQVTIAVTDTGRGMDDATMSRVFDPYFTTREGGSGLGLATVRAIVGRRGGTVRVDSLEGVGTTFHVTFPMIQS